MSAEQGPDPVARVAELLTRSSLNEPALQRLYARVPRRGFAPPPRVTVLVADFATRLNELFDPEPEQRAHTNGEVAAQLTAWGHPISKPYLSQLRAGERTDPSGETVAALARYFRVRPDYFLKEDFIDKSVHDLELLTRLQFYGLRRLSTHAFDLSEESQNLLTSMADRLRITEGLPEVPARDPE